MDGKSESTEIQQFIYQYTLSLFTVGLSMSLYLAAFVGGTFGVILIPKFYLPSIVFASIVFLEIIAYVSAWYYKQKLWSYVGAKIHLNQPFLKFLLQIMVATIVGISPWFAYFISLVVKNWFA